MIVCECAVSVSDKVVHVAQVQKMASNDDQLKILIKALSCFPSSIYADITWRNAALDIRPTARPAVHCLIDLTHKNPALLH